ncbi:uncharacterized protein FIBRA_07227 [Fibroporia radiculosa]|uniref:Uncharacterized protein n=1 Tax=Fibroporia radiculosa TaxID=599839 RepID=J4I0C4_9APHY|nr:uncharacterized protein FIBRA_07227 [Fibroporia radiculosa]CCM05027.1 predicted protein [Fibroporia radiculosa]
MQTARTPDGLWINWDLPTKEYTEVTLVQEFPHYTTSSLAVVAPGSPKAAAFPDSLSRVLTLQAVLILWRNHAGTEWTLVQNMLKISTPITTLSQMVLPALRPRHTGSAPKAALVHLAFICLLRLALNMVLCVNIHMTLLQMAVAATVPPNIRVPGGFMQTMVNPLCSPPEVATILPNTTLLH